jgi:3-hydroxymyristoyl/3-hydroxydecanoyl-(acyl carrier protein) dehydratase
VESRRVNEPHARHETRIRVAPDHPALPGHFPGAPIVPGVLLLDRVLAGAEAWLGCALHPTGVPQVKFRAPLLPGEDVQLSLELAAVSLKFVVSRGGQTIAAGTFSLATVRGAQPAMNTGAK